MDTASFLNGLPLNVQQEIVASSDKQSSLINALINNHEQSVQKLEVSIFAYSHQNFLLMNQFTVVKCRQKILRCGGKL
jgi:hypothetical protein